MYRWGRCVERKKERGEGGEGGRGCLDGERGREEGIWREGRRKKTEVIHAAGQPRRNVSLQ